MNYYDYIIVGGGASGLLMAYRMSKDPFFDDKSILIVDEVKKKVNDKTWCYWEEQDGEWNDILTTSWKNIVFKSAIYNKVENIAPYQYKMIRSKDFYLKIWNQIASKINISFLEESVLNINQLSSEAEVITENKVYSNNASFLL